MPEVSATEAARAFAGLLDAVEHRGEHFTIVRQGKIVAQLDPVTLGRGADVKSILRRHAVDSSWSDDLRSLRGHVEYRFDAPY